ncbi:unnamed protein product [Microthlaspi erraticum]|uniref:NB-ARC domain-containing protein n=1 Tax=Microthlaspi erraticum TaxID=1685480 RepID=A0A6D2KFV6_9BRAS|nr:unnamed protein product [Microthlaspi erraticum]
MKVKILSQTGLYSIKARSKHRAHIWGFLLVIKVILDDVWTREALDRLTFNLPGCTTLVVSRSKLAKPEATYDVEEYFITNTEPIKFWEFMSQLLEGLGYERLVLPIISHHLKAKEDLGYVPFKSSREGFRDGDGLRTIFRHTHETSLVPQNTKPRSDPSPLKEEKDVAGRKRDRDEEHKALRGESKHDTRKRETQEESSSSSPRKQSSLLSASDQKISPVP